MKIKIFLFFFATLLVLLPGCSMFNIVKGDGNLVTNEISIGEYDGMDIAGSLDINYTQSEASPGLTVTVDKNIFDMYEFKVANNTLLIQLKKEFKSSVVSPTKFVVTTNSRVLKQADLAGHVIFKTDAPLIADQLKIGMAGAGDINLNDSVKANKLHIELAGSATLNAPAVHVGSFEGEVAGSGTFNLSGSADKASFEIAGNGNVSAFGLQIADMRCEIAGNGTIEASVSTSIVAEVAGRGNIKYKGNPTISKEIGGIGSIEKVD